VPADIPVTILPMAIGITVAVVLLLLHVPPGSAAADKVMLAPVHRLEEPVIVPASGSGFTVTVAVVAALPQLLVTSYLIVSTPADTPETTPPNTLAAELLLLHTSLVNSELVENTDKVTVAPTHTLAKPAIVPATGNESTVIISVSIHPVLST
jgi:hypothetical protein